MAENRSKSDQYLLRLPPGLREELKEAADLHARSLNAEIVERLERYPKLVRLPMDVAYLEMENKRLAQELGVAQGALDDAKASGDIEARLTELKEQISYFESLKVGLLDLSNQGLKLDENKEKLIGEQDNLIEEQRKLIEQLDASAKQNRVLMKQLLALIEGAASGDTSQLDRLLEQVRIKNQSASAAGGSE